MRSDLSGVFQSFCWVVSSFLELLTVSTCGWAFKHFVGYRKGRIPLGLQEGEISQNHFCWHSLIAEDRVLLLRPLSNSVVGAQYFLWLLQLRWASKIYYSFWTSPFHGWTRCRLIVGISRWLMFTRIWRGVNELNVLTCSDSNDVRAKWTSLVKGPQHLILWLGQVRRNISPKGMEQFDDSKWCVISPRENRPPGI